MSWLDDAKSWVGDHITGPPLNPVLGIVGVGPDKITNLTNTDRPLSVAPPLGTADRKAWDAAGGTPPADTHATSSGGLGHFGMWLAAMGALAAVVLLMDENSNTAPVGAALMWLIVGTFFLVRFKDVTLGFDQAFGTNFTAA